MSDYKLEMYNILNGIKTHARKTRYPYSYWTTDKIVETKNKIKLVYSKNEEFFMRPKKKKWIKGGGELYSDGLTLVI